jgi:multidrug transporter EmrE-like cation transporter
VVVFDERVTPMMAVGIVVLMFGVVLVELGSPH